MSKVWFWFFQVFYLILLSIVPYFAWTNQLTFKEGYEFLGKIGVTGISLIMFIIAEMILCRAIKDNIA